MKKGTKIASFLLGIILAFSVATTAFAYVRVDTAAATSLSVSFVDNEEGGYGAIEGAVFNLYRVADVSDAVQYTLAGSFVSAPVSLEITTASGWTDLATTLSSYIAANNIIPDVTATTDANGVATFSGLSVGLYLLAEGVVNIEDTGYATAASMIMLPTLMTDDTWNYSPSVSVKYDKSDLSEGLIDEKTITVKKVWEDEETENRPDSVEMQLIQDGEVIASVDLSEENNWTHTWNEYTIGYRVEEGVYAEYNYEIYEINGPEEYTVSINENKPSRDLLEVTVTNTLKEEPDEPQTEPSTNAPTAPPADNTPTPRSDDKLPQTGTLNWPIPVLTVCGLFLMIVGWYMVSSGKKSK